MINWVLITSQQRWFHIPISGWSGEVKNEARHLMLKGKGEASYYILIICINVVFMWGILSLF